MPSVCRVCGCTLTIDNTYLSDIKHKNRICKKCSNARRNDREQRKRSLQFVQSDEPLNIDATYSIDWTHVKSRTINSQDPFGQPVSVVTCSNCKAHDAISHECHFNPPPWYKVHPTNWCIKFLPKQ